MKDGPFRVALKAVARAVFFANLRGSRLIWRLRGDKPFILAGSCGTCGKCCESPSVQVGRVVWFFPTARKLFLAWQKHVNGFVLKDRQISGRVFVFECTHFDRATRRCDSYDSRPGMCRDYPRGLLWQASPEMLPGCGYRPLAPGADRFVAALEREGLDAESIEKLKAKLNLKQ